MVLIKKKLRVQGWWKTRGTPPSPDHIEPRSTRKFFLQQPAIEWAQRFGQKLGYQQPQPPESAQCAQNLATDWIWRPEIWQTPSHHPAVSGGANGVALNHGTKLFHSAARAQITSRQIDQTGDPSRAPFGLGLDVYDFSGGYISLAIQLPALAAKDLQSRHLI